MAKPPASNTPPMQESPSLAGRRRACAISDRRRRFEGHGQETTQPWWLILDLRQLVKTSSDLAQLPGPSKKKVCHGRMKIIFKIPVARKRR